MPKIYQEKPENEELFLRLRDNGFDDGVLLRVVTDEGQNHADGVLCKLTSLGIFLPGGVSDEVAARAGFSPDALDANGRLKVIGQEVEAERLDWQAYRAEPKHGSGTLSIRSRPDGCLMFLAGDDSTEFATSLSPADLRDFAARLNRHVAFLDKDGLG